MDRTMSGKEKSRKLPAAVSRIRKRKGGEMPGTMTQPLVVFALDDQRYALALACVQRSIRAVAITLLPKAPAIVLGIIDLAGEVIPVIDMRRRFHQPPRDIRLSDHLLVADGRPDEPSRSWSMKPRG